jgi:hypothetical protein
MIGFRHTRTCDQRHVWLPVSCILGRRHVGQHWGPLNERRFVEWRGNVGRVVTPERVA